MFPPPCALTPTNNDYSVLFPQKSPPPQFGPLTLLFVPETSGRTISFCQFSVMFTCMCSTVSRTFFFPPPLWQPPFGVTFSESVPFPPSNLHLFYLTSIFGLTVQETLLPPIPTGRRKAVFCPPQMFQIHLPDPEPEQCFLYFFCRILRFDSPPPFHPSPFPPPGVKPFFQLLGDQVLVLVSRFG